MNIPSDRVRAQIVSLLVAWGMPAEAAAITADVMVETDLAGIDSHGVSMLSYYEDLRSRGHIDFGARPEVVRDGPAIASVDGHNGLGHPAAVMGMKLAMGKARSFGIGAVTVRNSAHFGAAGYYTALAAKDGLIGIAMTTTRMVGVVPTRSQVPALGTNPIAFAAPAGRNRPFSLDMSTSTAAINKVRVMALANKPLPAGWVLDGEGRPVTDPAAAMRIVATPGRGGVTALGGTPEMASHKGYGLAVMVQILAGTLAGASFSALRETKPHREEPDNIGHFFLALDPHAFREADDFEQELDAAIDCLRSLAPVDAALPVLVPGDPEAATSEQRRRDGIPLSDALAGQIEAICGRHGVPFLLRP